MDFTLFDLVIQEIESIINYWVKMEKIEEIMLMCLSSKARKINYHKKWQETII